MSKYLLALKDQFSVISILIVLFLIACVLFRLKKRKAFQLLLFFDLVLFLVSATSYLPHYLASQLEKNYLPFNPDTLIGTKGKIYIHLLGSGYNLDGRLPANAQLGLTAQGRLIEAIRIYRRLDRSILVTSAGSFMGLETQASVAKRAAILLGVDSNRIITLDKPNNTIEEAQSLKNMVGYTANVIVVTDASHMPRAISAFKQQGFSPKAAPTNFRAPEGPKGVGFKWWPSTSNISLMDIVLHEWLWRLKAAF